ncbi:MAG: porin [Myxococcota bacterium]
MTSPALHCRLAFAILFVATLALAAPAHAGPVDLADDATPTTKQAKAGKKSLGPAVKVGGVVQLRYSLGPNWRGGHPDGVTGPLATAWTHSFSVPRARLEVATDVLNWKLRTKVDFGRGMVRLLNAYAERELGLGTQLKLGQFKRIFSQTYLISAEESQLYERPDVVSEAGGSRDIGVLLSGDWLGERVMAAVGAFNGNGMNTESNDNANLRVEARLDLAPLGKYDLVSHPIGRKPKIRLGGGVARYQDNASLKAQVGGKSVQIKQFDETTAFSAFAAARWQGVELRAEGFQGTRDPTDARASDAQVPSLASLGVKPVDWRGGYVQVAADMPFHRALQVAAAAEEWEPDAAIRTDSDTRYTVALNYYLDGDAAKVQAAWQDRTLRRAGTDESTHWTAFLQLQLAY